ncbi:MAG: hypothetical protein ACLPYY_08925 [Acidimicrobiales bacterium]
MTSAVSTSSDSWVMLPMGELSVQDNTFWQLLHTVPGSSQWSVVTPEGVADNGGLVAGTAGGSIVIGFLPSQQLHYSPLAQSIDGGATWSPQLLPAALAPIPDALSYAARAGGALAVIAGDRVLSAPPGLSRWSLLVTASRLARNFAGCGVTTIDAVAILPTGSPLVATGCRGNGVVGVFAKTGGAWRPYGTLPRGLSHSATDVLRLEVSGTTVAALAATNTGGKRALVALWRDGGAPWTTETTFVLPARASVLASAVGEDGAMAVLLRSHRAAVTAYSVEPGGAWARLAQPPVGTTAIALPSGPATTNGLTVDAFTVQGGAFGVYALGPTASRWVRVQSSQIAIPYGSSS